MRMLFVPFVQKVLAASQSANKQKKKKKIHTETRFKGILTHTDPIYITYTQIKRRKKKKKKPINNKTSLKKKNTYTSNKKKKKGTKNK